MDLKFQGETFSQFDRVENFMEINFMDQLSSIAMLRTSCETFHMLNFHGLKHSHENRFMCHKRLVLHGNRVSLFQTHQWVSSSKHTKLVKFITQTVVATLTAAKTP